MDIRCRLRFIPGCVYILNVAGAFSLQIVYDELMKAITANFPELLPENLQEVFVQ